MCGRRSRARWVPGSGPFSSDGRCASLPGRWTRRPTEGPHCSAWRARWSSPTGVRLPRGSRPPASSRRIWRAGTSPKRSGSGSAPATGVAFSCAAHDAATSPGLRGWHQATCPMGGFVETPPQQGGLTSAQVAQRVTTGETNDTARRTSRPVSHIVRANVLTRFNAIVGALAAVVLVTGHPQDALFGLVIVANTGIGVIQELRAKRTLDRLAVLGEEPVQVMRDGAETALRPQDIVLDDLILIGPGDRVMVAGAVAGIVTMIPEGLVLLTSVAFAVGVVRLGRRRCLVQQLPAIEVLARVDVLCLDKTGTLTEPGMELDQVIEVAPGVPVRKVLASLVGAEERPNPTMQAIASGLVGLP